MQGSFHKRKRKQSFYKEGIRFKTKLWLVTNVAFQQREENRCPRILLKNQLEMRLEQKPTFHIRY